MIFSLEKHFLQLEMGTCEDVESNKHTELRSVYSMSEHSALLTETRDALKEKELDIIPRNSSSPESTAPTTAL